MASCLPDDPSLRRLSVDPGAVVEADLAPTDRFASLAVLHYDESDAPPRRQEAAALLAADPRLAAESIWSAAAAADPEAVARRLGSATLRGGPLDWEPLLYLCFSRVPAAPEQVLETATLLLGAGADPNTGYLWRGLATPFTALTGVFGDGEQGPRRQPPHPDADALATLLLERGAHPVDQQTLYNRMFRPDDAHLDLLFAHGLADAEPSPWEIRLGGAMETREQVWRRQIDWAAAHGFADRIALLGRNGIDVSGVEVVVPGPDDPLARDQDGATALHQAAYDGDLERIRSLLAAGADISAVDARFDGTPLDWAEHAYQGEAAELLRAARP